MPNIMVSDKGQIKAGATSISPLALALADSSMSFHIIGEYLVSPPNTSCHKSLFEDTGDD